MTKTYLVGQITLTNPEGYAGYQAQVPQIVADFGGKYLVRGGHTTQLEGQSQGDRNVVIEFPSRQMAEAWYNSPAYQAILPHRQNNSVGHLVFVDGYSAA
jgi:uncharacterized protein (DUF1330 family)